MRSSFFNNSLSEEKAPLLFGDIAKIGILLCCYIVASLFALKSHTVLFSSFERDGTEFLFDAKRILNGQGYDSDFWPFGYMMSIAGFKFLTAVDYFTAGKLITLISGLGSCILVFFISKTVFSAKTGLLAVAILATNHMFFLHSFLIETDMLFTLFFLLAIYLLVRKDGMRDFFMAGAAAGIAYMVKYGVYAFFPVVLLLSLLDIRVKGLFDPVKKFSAFLVAFLIFASPWLVYNNKINDSPTYSKHYLNIAWGMNRPTPVTPEYWRSYFQISDQYSSMKDVVKDTKKFLKNWTGNIKGLNWNVFRSLSIMSFFLLPAFFMLFKSPDRKKLILMLMILSFLSLVTIAYTWDRYLLPIIPLFSILIAFSLLEIVPKTFNAGNFIKKFSLNIPFRALVICALLTISAVESFAVVRDFIKKEETHEYKDVGEWLKKELKEDEWIMVSNPQVAWYSGTDRFVKYPKNDDITLKDAVRMREQNTFFFTQEGLSSRIVTDIDYFVYEEKRWLKMVSGNAPLIPKNFVSVFTIKGNKTNIVVYKVHASDID